MKTPITLIIALLMAGAVHADANKNSGTETPPQKQKQCFDQDAEDTTDVLAIPLDEDSYEQCEEINLLEKGAPAKVPQSNQPSR